MKRFLGIGLSITLLSFAGCSDDDAGACIDSDGDGYDVYDADDCPTGDDECDSDANNWTATGCADCVDGDGDGYGVDCDLGPDCDDADDSIHTGCGGCVDGDADGHDGYDADECPSGDDECDSDANNWTATGCADCVDGDSDGYGVDCDLGPDCDDADDAIHTGCVGCVDDDADGHDGYDATTCPAGDDHCDGDTNNWTTTGCTSCVDNDGDGYGTYCDLGGDCNDSNPNNQTAQCQSFHYRGDFVTNGTDEVAVVTYPGPTESILALTGLDHDAGIDDMALSPDGSHIAVSGQDSGGDNVLLLYAADGSGTPVTLALYSETWDVDMDQLAFSPDGAWLAYRADAEIGGGDALYVVPTDGTVAPKLVTQVPATNDNDVSSFVWSSDTSTSARYLGYRGDMVTDDAFGLWVVDITAATPAPVEIETAEAHFLLAFDAQGRLTYRILVGGVYQLWQSDLTGTTKEQVPGTVLTNASGDASIGTFGMSPSGTKIAFSADAPTADLYEVYVLDLANTTAVLVSSVSAITPAGVTSGPSFFQPIIWSPDETMVAVVADWQLAAGEFDNDYSAYILPTAAPAGGVRLVGPAAWGANQDVVEMLFSMDSSRVFILGDLVDNNDTEVFSTDDLTTAEQDAATLVLRDVATGGDVAHMMVP